MPKFTIGFTDPRMIGWSEPDEYEVGIGPVYYDAVIAPFVSELKNPSPVDLKDAHETFAASAEADTEAVAAGRRFIRWAEQLWEPRGYGPDNPLALSLSIN